MNNSDPAKCQSCGQLVAAGSPYCPTCGVRLGSAETRGPNLPPSEEWDPVLQADLRASPRQAKHRTQTGLLLMAVAFSLLWIPYVSDLGEILAVVGILLLLLGRHEFDEAHWRSILRGSVCVVLSLLIGIGAGIWFAGSLFAAASMPTVTIPAFVSLVQQDLAWLFGAAVVSTMLGSFGYLLLPYALADKDSRFLLWTAFLLSIGITLFSLAFLETHVSSALAQATAGSMINSAPIQSLQTQELLLGTLQLGPNILFLWAYRRVRHHTLPSSPEEEPNRQIPSSFERID